jgi:hypothetical protein
VWAVTELAEPNLACVFTTSGGSPDDRPFHRIAFCPR